VRDNISAKKKKRKQTNYGITNIIVQEKGERISVK
jgi:hypothetical protein